MTHVLTLSLRVSDFILHTAIQPNMKISICAFLAMFAFANAFTPQTQSTRPTTLLQAEATSRKAFLAVAGMALLGGGNVAAVWAMDQENVDTPTEQWETGSPSPEAEKARVDRMSVRRTQLDSNFAPIKRLTVERKSPVVRFSYSHLEEYTTDNNVSRV